MKHFEIEEGLTLLTRDGRRIGNALVIHVIDKILYKKYVIQTDFGNVLLVDEAFICENFFKGSYRSVQHQLKAQAVLLGYEERQWHTE